MLLVGRQYMRVSAFPTAARSSRRHAALRRHGEAAVASSWQSEGRAGCSPLPRQQPVERVRQGEDQSHGAGSGDDDEPHALAVPDTGQHLPAGDADPRAARLATRSRRWTVRRSAAFRRSRRSAHVLITAANAHSPISGHQFAM